MGLNRTSMSKVMVVWIGPEILCSILSVSINYLPQSDIWVKIYDHLKFSRTSVFQFREFWYIMGHNRTPMSKVMVEFRRPELRCSILSVLINYVPKLDIRVKSYDHLNFSRTSTFECRVCRYIIGLNRKSMSKVMVVLTGPELPCSISSVSINYVSELDIRVKSYDRLNFSRTSIFQFQASQYFMCLNRTSMLKVMAGWIGPELSCLISTVSIYYVPESDIRLKCYDHFNFSSTTIFQFRTSRYIMGLNRTPMSKVMAVW